MVDFRLDAKGCGEVDEAAGLRRGHQEPGKLGSIDARGGNADAFANEAAEVERDVVADHDVAADEVEEVTGDRIEGRGAADGLVRDAGQALDEARNRSPGVDERLEGSEFAAIVVETDGADLRDAVGIGVEAGGFEVNSDVHAVRTSVRISRVYAGKPEAASRSCCTARERQQVSGR